MKIKPLWFLFIAAGLLLLWSLVRERFEPTQSIKAPPYGKDEKIRILGLARPEYQSILMDKAKQQLPGEKDDNKLKEAAGGIVSPVVEEFFTKVFKPATNPVSETEIDEFLKNRSSDIKMIEKDVLKVYFVDQSGVGTSVKSGYADVLKGLGQNAGYLVDSPPPVCPVGTVLDARNKCVSSTATPFTCPDGYEISGMTCKKKDGTETTEPTCPSGMKYSTEVNACQTEAIPSCPAGYEYKDGACKEKNTGGMATGTDTGGSSTTSYGPTSGVPSGRNRQVFGPVFTSMAAPVAGGQGRDSSKTNKYPELMGGMMDTSTRIPGAGIVAPSKNWTLANDGSLPPDSSLGVDEMAKFLPYSRQPGDMDVLPNPARIGNAPFFGTKTEPVPFLTDFSAFLK